MDEQSVVLVKPDGVKRRLIGEIISRFEKTGLELVSCKMVNVTPDMAIKHYGQEEDWFIKVGEKLLDFYQEYGKDPQEEVGTKEPKEIGRLVQKWNVDYLTQGKVLAMLWKGPHAIKIIRKIVGSTYPQEARPGTIRGDYSFDSPATANTEGRSVHNLIHASGSPEEAQFERELWFKEDEIYD